MSMPTITVDDIAAHLKAQKLGVEIFTEFPSDYKNVRHGVYLEDPAPVDRSPYQLAIQGCGPIYTVTDGFKIIQVSFQGDVNKDAVSGAITEIVNSDIVDGYHERDYTMDEEYLNRAEYRVWEFSLKRIDLQP